MLSAQGSKGHSGDCLVCSRCRRWWNLLSLCLASLSVVLLWPLLWLLWRWDDSVRSFKKLHFHGKGTFVNLICRSENGKMLFLQVGERERERDKKQCALSSRNWICVQFRELDDTEHDESHVNDFCCWMTSFFCLLCDVRLPHKNTPFFALRTTLRHSAIPSLFSLECTLRTLKNPSKRKQIWNNSSGVILKSPLLSQWRNTLHRLKRAPGCLCSLRKGEGSECDLFPIAHTQQPQFSLIRIYRPPNGMPCTCRSGSGKCPWSLKSKHMTSSAHSQVSILHTKNL